MKTTATKTETASEFCLFPAGFSDCGCSRCRAEMARLAFVATLPKVDINSIEIVLPARRTRRVK